MKYCLLYYVGTKVGFIQKRNHAKSIYDICFGWMRLCAPYQEMKNVHNLHEIFALLSRLLSCSVCTLTFEEHHFKAVSGPDIFNFSQYLQESSRLQVTEYFF